MILKDARKWIAVYFLLVTVVVGGYLLLFGKTRLLPIDKNHAASAFQILIPVLVGQITVIFQWLSRGNSEDDHMPSPIPSWAIKLPPVLVVGLLVAGVVVLVVGNWEDGNSAAMGPEEFKTVFTFAVSILNASSLFLVARLFPKST